jgi:hypothetical protein
MHVETHCTVPCLPLTRTLAVSPPLPPRRRSDMQLFQGQLVSLTATEAEVKAATAAAEARAAAAEQQRQAAEGARRRAEARCEGARQQLEAAKGEVETLRCAAACAVRAAAHDSSVCA